MILRYATVVLVAAILATVAALSISAVEPTKAEAQTSTVATCDGATIELRIIEKRVFNLHNRARENYGLAPLCVDPALTEAARAHSADMIEGDYFAHVLVGGPTHQLWLRLVHLRREHRGGIRLYCLPG